LISSLKISAGEVSEWLPPLLFAAAVLVSAWTLYDARRRRFPLYAVAAWTLATLIFPHIVLPLYLIARMLTPQRDSATAPEASDDPSTVTEAADASSAEPAQISDDTDKTTTTAAPPQEIRVPLLRRGFAPPLIYALVLLSIGAIYFYRDYHSFDAYHARAANARLLYQHAAAIRAYRAALRLSDDAHTHQLLAVQLAEDGQTEAALTEFRAAEQGGEPDALLPYHIAHTLDALGRPAEAAVEYQKFLRGDLCARPSPDTRCAEASGRVQQQMRSGVGAR
jgi:tetratricopeptide (TPR) repeat protein